MKVYLLSCRPVPLYHSLLVLSLLPVAPVVDPAQRRLVDVQGVAVPQLGPAPQSQQSRSQVRPGISNADFGGTLGKKGSFIKGNFYDF